MAGARVRRHPHANDALDAAEIGRARGDGDEIDDDKTKGAAAGRIASRRNRIVAVVLCVVALTTFLLYGVRPRTPSIARAERSIAAPGIFDDAIRLATTYMLRSVQDDGSFLYQAGIDDQGRVTRSPKYNVLRHAGAIFALADACRPRGGGTGWDAVPRFCAAGKDGGRFRDAIIKTAQWLEREAVTKAPSADLYVVFKPHLSSLRDEPGGLASRKVALGGNGLGLVGMSVANAIAPGTVPLTTLVEIGQYTIEHMIRDDGSYVSLAEPFAGHDDTLVIKSGFKSLYYPGEASLGLLRLSKLLRRVGNDAGAAYMLAGSLRIITNLAAERQVEGAEVPPDHWACIASAELLQQPDLSDASRTMLLRHAGQVLGVITQRMAAQFAVGMPLGVSSLATMLEAQFAMLPELRGARGPEGDGKGEGEGVGEGGEGLMAFGVDLREAWCISEHVALVLAHVQQSERPGELAGAMPHKFSLAASIGKEELIGGRAAPTITHVEPKFRIDDSQHTLSAWLSYERAQPSFRDVVCGP